MGTGSSCVGGVQLKLNWDSFWFFPKISRQAANSMGCGGHSKLSHSQGNEPMQTTSHKTLDEARKAASVTYGDKCGSSRRWQVSTACGGLCTLWLVKVRRVKLVHGFNCLQRALCVAFQLPSNQLTVSIFNRWLAPSGLSKLDFGMSRFGDSLDCPTITETIAKTTQLPTPFSNFDEPLVHFDKCINTVWRLFRWRSLPPFFLFWP